MDVDEEAGKAKPKKAVAGSSRGRASLGPKRGEAKKKEEEEQFADGALIDTGLKQQRFAEEKALKVLKWAFATPEPEHVEQLKAQLALVTKPALHTQLFHADFKQHLKALDALIAALAVCPDAALGCSDLLIKWCSLRFFDTNPTVLAKTLAFLTALLQLMADTDGYRLADTEATALLPYLLLKAGDGKENIRNGVRTIVDQTVCLYPASKVYPIILESTKVKNSKQKAVCLEFLARLVEEFGMSICGPASAGAVKQMATAIGDRDQAVRNAALNCMLSVHMHIGERLYKQVTHLGQKEMGMLEERIKRSAAKPGPRISLGPASARTPSAQPPRHRSQTPSGRSQTPIRGSRSMQAMGDKGLHPPQNGLPNGHSDEDLPRRSQIPDDGGFFPRLPNGEYDWPRMGFDWAPKESFQVAEPTLVEWQSVFEEDAANPFVYPKLNFDPAARLTRRGSQQSLASVGSSSTVMDTSAALDQTISQITSKAITTAIASLGQLDELLKEAAAAAAGHESPGRAELLVGKVDQVLMAVFFQLRLCSNSHLGDARVEKDHIIELYRAVGNLLVSLMKMPALMREATENTLKDILMQLLTTLLDDRFKAPQFEHVVKSVNWLVVKLVEGAERTACLVALMSLLRETLSSQTASPKFVDLCLKCLWRKCKELQSQSASGEVEIVAGPVIEEAERFYDTFPPATYWKDRDDKPLKTIKTLLNYLAKAMGPRILDETGGLREPDPAKSEVIAYLKKSLRDLPAKEENGNSSRPLGATGMTESVTIQPGRSLADSKKLPLAEANNNAPSASQVSSTAHPYLNYAH